MGVCPSTAIAKIVVGVSNFIFDFPLAGVGSSVSGQYWHNIHMTNIIDMVLARSSFNIRADVRVSDCSSADIL